MAVSVVSPLLKRLTFVNWDKNGNIFHIDNNCVDPYRRVPLVRMRSRRAPVRPGSVRRRSL